MTRRPTLEERFWSAVSPEPNSGCWLWTGYTVGRGYGRLGDGTKRMRLATHVSLQLAGRPAAPGMCVCHRCDMPSCVNPDHLFIGTQADNVRDMHTKGRWRAPRRRRGIDLPQTKLTPDLVREIRSKLADGLPQQKIADAVGVARTTVSTIATGRAWRWL
jgi:hypothetical protein